MKQIIYKNSIFLDGEVQTKLSDNSDSIVKNKNKKRQFE